MKFALKSDSTFLSFLKNGKGRFVWLILLALGVLLLLVGGKSTAPAQTDTGADECEKLCAEVEELCAAVKGVGKCRVMLSFSRGAVKEYRGSNVVSVTPPQVSAAVVVCEGGASPTVQKELNDLLSALFDLSANRIRVEPMR